MQDMLLSVPRQEPEIIGVKKLNAVAQWIEHWLANQRVAGSIPSQGTCLGCRPGSQYGAHEKQPHIDVSLPLFLFTFLSL